METLIREWNGRTIRQREDGYMSLTDMCQACGKLFGNWKQLKATDSYIEALSSDIGIPISQLIEVSKGNSADIVQGTWGHRLAALELSRWLSPEFSIQCNKWIEELLTKGSVSLSTAPVMPQTYLEALKALVASEEAKELLKIENEQLREDVDQLSEIADELFDYSSIIRIAKFNKCKETAFDWRKLKACSTAKRLDVKKAPCPRFGSKNLYHHDVWRMAYPNFKLPETTTLVINR